MMTGQKVAAVGTQLIVVRHQRLASVTPLDGRFLAQHGEVRHGEAISEQPHAESAGEEECDRPGSLAGFAARRGDLRER